MTKTVSLSLMLRNIAKPQDISVQEYLSKINAKE